MQSFKHTMLNNLKIIILAALLAVGASYAYAWAGPAGAPPNANTAAPLNVSDVNQVKPGKLALKALLVAGQVQIFDGTQGLGKILTSSADGTASWVDASSVTTSGNAIVCARKGNSGVMPTEANVGTAYLVKFNSGECSAGILPDASYVASLKSITFSGGVNAIQALGAGEYGKGITTMSGPGIRFNAPSGVNAGEYDLSALYVKGSLPTAAPSMTASCMGTPLAKNGTVWPVTWTASLYGGSGSHTFSWNLSPQASQTGNPVTANYGTTNLGRTATVTVDGGATTATCST